MRTKVEIERSLAEMKRMADDALRGLAKAQEMEATVLVRHFEIWKAKCEARAQILSWVLGQEFIEDTTATIAANPMLGGPKAEPLPCDYRKHECSNTGEIVNGVWVCSNHQHGNGT